MVKISVIVPVYNVEEHLNKCLSSLVHQSLEDLEIIVINDGSTDSSHSIIDHYTRMYPRLVKSFTKENGGLSDARNFGLDKATGKYIGFVDSDDFVTENMFEEMYLLAEKHQAEIVICNLRKIDNTGREKQKLTQIPHLPEKINLKDEFTVFSDISYFACNKIFKREVFENHRFAIGKHFEDIQLIPRLLLQCTTLAHTNAYHYQYLERENSITKTHTENGLDILSAVKEVEKAFYLSPYKDYFDELKGFQILEGFYSFLAYLAFVKDKNSYKMMSRELKLFLKERKISKTDIIKYRRFGKNYLLSLPFKKKLYYLMWFLGMETLLRKMV